MSMESKDLLKYSKRQYQHLYAGTCWRQMDKIIDMLSEPGHPWRIIHFYDLKFITNEDFEKCLTGIEKTIQEIGFDKVGIHRPTSYRTDYYFPNLAVLKIKDCDWSLHEPFMYTSQLRELHLEHDPAIDNIETFQRIMTLNADLKILVLPVHCFDSLVQKEVTDEIKFKLRILTVTRLVYPYDYGSSQSHLAYFLKFQTNIKELSIAEWIDPEVFITIFDHLKKLEKLTLQKIEKCEENFEWKKLTLKPIHSLLDLEYEDMKGNADMFDAVVEAAKNLKVLSLYSLTQDMLDNSMNKLVNLEHLAVRLLDIREVNQKNILLKLKSITCNTYDLRLQSNLENLTKARRGHLENILFDNSYGRVDYDVTVDNFVRLD
ncbi:unnamed protein product [Diamesa hyperborea]